jgi:hypothetical protein
MSLGSIFSGVVQASLQLGIGSNIIKPQRGIYNIVLPDGSTLPDITPQLVEQERSTDQMEITTNPIEVGAPVSDHAYKVPAVVEVRIWWSNSPSNTSLYGTISGAAALNPAIRQALDLYNEFTSLQSILSGSATSQMATIYAQLLKVQAQKGLFTLYTGKRIYDQMVIKTLTQTTNKMTENSLEIVLTCQQLIIVNTQTATLSKALQKYARKTASPVSKGKISLKQVN